MDEQARRVETAPPTSLGPSGERSADRSTLSPQSVESSPLRGTRTAGRGGRTVGSVLLVAALCVAVGGVAFAVGRLTAPPASRAAGFGGFGGRGAGFGPGASGAPFQGGGGSFPGGGFLGSIAVEGTVTSAGDGRLALQLASGATVEIELAPTTTYHRQAAASATDVGPGSQVLVRLSGPAGPPAGTTSASPLPSGDRVLGPAADVMILAP